jgi:hypothetical protein
MYSEKITYNEVHKTTAVVVDGRDISTFGFSEREKDLLLTGIENYLLLKGNNGTDVVQTRVESRYRFLTKSFLYPFIKNRIYNKPEDLVLFESWFKQKCSRSLKQPVHSVQVLDSYYQFDAQRSSMKLIKTESVAHF